MKIVKSEQIYQNSTNEIVF